MIKAANRQHHYAINVDLIVWECPSCGIVYGIPKKFADECRENGTRYYCPNGHSLGWSETDADRERKQREATERRNAALVSQLDQAQSERDSYKNQARALKGVVTKTKKRAANGVCPVAGCKRHFANVAAHVARQHPEFKDAI